MRKDQVESQEIQAKMVPQESQVLKENRVQWVLQDLLALSEMLDQMGLLAFPVNLVGVENRELLEYLEEEDWKEPKDNWVALELQVHLDNLGLKENGDHQEKQDYQEDLVPQVQWVLLVIEAILVQREGKE